MPIDLPLFSGAHVPAVRFARALDELRLMDAMEDCPPPWREALGAMIEATELAGRHDLDRLLAARLPGWPEELERAWQRLVGRRLDGRGIPSVHAGEPAAAYLFRGGETQRGLKSLMRHLDRHPADVVAWALAVPFVGALAVARLAWHGGAILPEAGRWVEAIEEDEQPDPAAWMLAYAWFAGDLGLADLEPATRLMPRPLLLPGDGRAFTWHLVDLQAERDPMQVRRRLKQISPAGLRRYLERMGAG